ncbi:MAG: class I SAM-dependent methyltransferase [Actinomycetes bacterium]
MNPKHLALRDRWLEDTVAGLREHDDRLRGLDVQVRFDGGVAHVDGAVATPEDRERLRETICSLRGVYAMWDGVVVGDRGPLRTLDVGSGGTKQRATSVGVDRRPASGVDVLADVTARLPFADRSVDRVYAVHVLEHVLDMVGVMNELHRVLADDGVLHVLSPHWKSIGAVADPTHVKYLDVQTFKWFCGRHGGAHVWYPLHAACDGASVFADLTPVRDGEPLPEEERLARYFD